MNIRNLFFSYNLYSHLSTCTRVCNTSASLIDNIFCNMPFNVNVAVEDTFLSDHRLLLLHIPHLFNGDTDEKSSFTRCFNRTAKEQFANYLKSEVWTDMYDALDFDDKFNNFMSTLLYYFRICFPIRKIGKQSKQDSWITDEVIKCRENLKDLHVLTVKYPILNDTYKLKKQEYN